MTGHGSEPPGPGSEEASLWGTLEKLENGSLTPSESEALSQLLDRSAEARSVYLEYFELMSMLKVASELRAEEGLVPEIGGAGTQRRGMSLSVMAAAAIIVLLAGIAALIELRQPKPPFAVVELATGTTWMVDGQMQDLNSAQIEVVNGATVHVTSGTVALTLDSGVRMLLQGPMEVTFPELDQPVLKHGRLWVDSGEFHAGLQVNTPELQIRNLGTRFGVFARRDGLTEVHLISGRVEVEARRTNEIVAMGPEAKAMMIPAFGEAAELLLANDPFPELAELLARPRGYASTILSQTPSGYWRLDDEESVEIANAVSGGSLGSRQPAVEPAVPGVRPVDGFGGFEPENLAVFLTGPHGASVLHTLDAPGGISPREGGVSFWFRKDGISEQQEEILWYAGRKGSGLGPEDEMHLYLGPEGRLRFFMENGKHDILLSSSRKITDGMWHHVAASWERPKIELFLDGKSVMIDAEPRTISTHVFSGSEVRFGKPRVNYGGRQFQGCVDEIAYWNRSLTAAEVRNQYEAALSPPVPDIKPEQPPQE